MISLDPDAVFGSTRPNHPEPKSPTSGEKPEFSSEDETAEKPEATKPALEHRDTMMKLSEQMGEALSLANLDSAASVQSPTNRPMSPPITGLPPLLTTTNSAVALDDLQATLAYMLQSPRSAAPSQFSPTTSDDAVSLALNEAMSSSAMVIDAPISDKSVTQS